MKTGPLQRDLGQMPRSAAGLAALDLDLGRYAEWPNPERVAPNLLRLHCEWRGEGDVVVRVRACSLNYYDVFTRRGMPGI